MIESVFRLLFSYRPVVFQQGEFRLLPSAGSYLAAVLAAAARADRNLATILRGVIARL